MVKKGIYKITNTRTGKAYVGQSVDMRKRWNQHQNELNRGTHHNVGLQRDWNNGDKFNFRVLEETPYLDEREKYYISFYDTYHNGYNMNRGGSGVKYSPTYYQEDKSVENFFIACGVFLGVYILALFISSFIFRPLGNYNDMIISTIVALFSSIYVILRWKKGFRLGLSNIFVRSNNSGVVTENTASGSNITQNYKTTINHNNDLRNNETLNNEQNSSISLRTVNQYKLKIYNMSDESFRKVIGTFPSAEDSDKWKQINSFFKKKPHREIIKKVDKILVEEIFENIAVERKSAYPVAIKRNILKIYLMEDKSFKELCDYFAVNKYLEKEKKIEFLFNNHSSRQIMIKATEILGKNIKNF